MQFLGRPFRYWLNPENEPELWSKVAVILRAHAPPLLCAAVAGLIWWTCRDWLVVFSQPWGRHIGLWLALSWVFGFGAGFYLRPKV